MNNPYQTPQSDIDLSATLPIARNIVWKIFVWLILFLELFSDLETFVLSDDAVTILNIIGLPVYLITLLGLFGFAYSKTYLNPLFWKIFFPIVLVMDGISIKQELIPIFQGEKNQLIISIIVIVTISAPIILLQYYAMYQYAFANRKLWQIASKNLTK